MCEASGIESNMLLPYSRNARMTIANTILSGSSWKGEAKSTPEYQPMHGTILFPTGHYPTTQNDDYPTKFPMGTPVVVKLDEPISFKTKATNVESPLLYLTDSFQMTDNNEMASYIYLHDIAISMATLSLLGRLGAKKSMDNREEHEADLPILLRQNVQPKVNPRSINGRYEAVWSEKEKGHLMATYLGWNKDEFGDDSRLAIIPLSVIPHDRSNKKHNVELVTIDLPDGLTGKLHGGPQAGIADMASLRRLDGICSDTPNNGPSFLTPDALLVYTNQVLHSFGERYVIPWPLSHLSLCPLLTSVVAPADLTIFLVHKTFAI
jgi:hypothetical protein